MARASTVFACRECGGNSLRWAGQCPHCRAWNALEESSERLAPGRVSARGRRPVTAPRPIPITEVEDADVPRLALEWNELNRVLGGGVVVGSLVLLGGEPGVGKSTLLMHLAGQASARKATVLYTSGEESAQQVRMRAARLGALHPSLLMLAENDLDSITAAVEQHRPAIAIVDSIQTVYDPAVEAAPGSVTQVREASGRLMRLAKQSGVPLFLVGHVTKDGAIAGPRVLEHMVDTVLYLEGDRQQELRVLRATKNRFGPTDEIGIFAMGEQGLDEVPDPSAALLGEPRAVPGMAVTPALEGSRPLLVELQSLVADSSPYAMPRRSANGIDLNRLHMIIAVLEKRAGLPLGKSDIFVNVAGGLRISEPAADLGLALSIAGSHRKAAVAPATVVVGEVGLAGEVRRVTQLERRLQEAARHGFQRALVPAGLAASIPGIATVAVRDVKEAIQLAFGPASDRHEHARPVLLPARELRVPWIEEDEQR